MEIKEDGVRGIRISSNDLTIDEVRRSHSGRYSCAARNNIGETKADPININVRCKLSSLKRARIIFLQY